MQQQNKITKITALKEPQFIKPIAIEYQLNGIERRWEAVISHDSVAILLYHKERESFVIVKQLRVPVLNANKVNGMMHELCAGIVDKDISLAQIAQEEILEECGYDLPLASVQKISSFYTSVGISGAKQTFFYAEIDESMKVSEGGGLSDEDIEVIYIPLSKAKEFMFDESAQKTPGLMMAFYWWFDTFSKSTSTHSQPSKI
jgi:UDP-sugar diphosphatase